MNPSVSVIIPVYNVEPYLERCLNSIVSQTFTEFECILVDDCSCDRSSVICDEYAERDTRFKVIHNTDRQGSSIARKTGLENSRGAYIQYIDSDDWIEPDMLEKMYDKAISEKCDIVYCDFIRFGEADAIRFTNIDVTGMERIDLLKNILACKLSWHIWNKLIKRELFDRVFFPVLQNGEDAVICIQLFNNCTRTGYVKSTLYHWFANLNSVSSSQDKDIKKLNEALENFKIIFKYLKIQYGKNIFRLQPELDSAINSYKIRIIKTGVIDYRVFRLFNLNLMGFITKGLTRKIFKHKNTQ